VKKAAALAALMLAACTAEAPAPDISVQDAWARATGPGGSSTAVYLAIRNRGGADRLVEVSSPAGQTSLHSTSVDGGVMRMRSVESLDIPAGSKVTLEPGGTHVMLTGLDAELAAGTTIPLELHFERSGEMTMEAAVRPASANGE
jgi:copper(I)-binding protein